MKQKIISIQGHDQPDFTEVNELIENGDWTVVSITPQIVAKTGTGNYDPDLFGGFAVLIENNEQEKDVI